MQIDSLSPQGAATTSSANSSAHFTAQDKNKPKLLKPPDTKAAPSKLNSKPLQTRLPTSPAPGRLSSLPQLLLGWVSLALEREGPVFSLPFGQLPWGTGLSQFSSFLDNDAACASDTASH